MYPLWDYLEIQTFENCGSKLKHSHKNDLKFDTHNKRKLFLENTCIQLRLKPVHWYNCHTVVKHWQWNKSSWGLRAHRGYSIPAFVFCRSQKWTSGRTVILVVCASNTSMLVFCVPMSLCSETHTGLIVVLDDTENLSCTHDWTLGDFVFLWCLTIKHGAITECTESMSCCIMKRKPLWGLTHEQNNIGSMCNSLKHQSVKFSIGLVECILVYESLQKSRVCR